MKILIGTPIHQLKDYAMEKWLQNVAKLTSTTPAHLLLIDNSPNLNYAKKVEGYCQKYRLKYQLQHLDFDSKTKKDIRIQASQETIRQYVISHDYEAFFSWECDQIIPENALDILVKTMLDSNCTMVIHDSKARWDPSITNTNMGCTLISREALEENWFLPTRNNKISLLESDSYDIDDAVFKKRVLANGGSYIELYGIIKPICHLEK